MHFVEACRTYMDPYLAGYDLAFIHADEENLPDAEGMVEKRPTTVLYAKPGLTVDVSNVLESKLSAYLYKMPLDRDCLKQPTLYEMDHCRRRLFNIQWARGIRPVEYVLRYETWEERIQVLIQAMEEAASDFLSGVFSEWGAIGSSTGFGQARRVN